MTADAQVAFIERMNQQAMVDVCGCVCVCGFARMWNHARSHLRERRSSKMQLYPAVWPFGVVCSKHL